MFFLSFRLTEHFIKIKIIKKFKLCVVENEEIQLILNLCLTTLHIKRNTIL